MNSQILKSKRRNRRKFSIRKQIFGMPDRLRLSVYKSLNHIYVQLIDDVSGKTLTSSSTLDKEVREQINSKMKKSDQSKLVGANLAKKAIGMNLKKVAFDRNGNLYHGRVKALADAAREAGLEF